MSNNPDRDEEYLNIVEKVGEGGLLLPLSSLMTYEIVRLQLLCDAELQDRAGQYPGGGN